MPIDSARVMSAVSELLAAIGDDPGRPGLVDTPQRVADAYAEFFAGVDADPLVPLADTVELDPGHEGELVLLRDVAFRSMCEHHLLPFTGVAHIAYLPDRAVVGLGRLPRALELLAARPQLQERLGEQLAAAIEEALAPRGVLVVLDARHSCVTARGVRQAESSTVTVASRGALSEPVAQAGVLGLVAGGGA